MSYRGGNVERLALSVEQQFSILRPNLGPRCFPKKHRDEVFARHKGQALRRRCVDLLSSCEDFAKLTHEFVELRLRGMGFGFSNSRMARPS